MTDDLEIKRLFAKARTEFDDNEEMMASISAGIAKLERLRTDNGRNKRKYLIGMLVASAVGALLSLLIVTVFRDAGSGLFRHSYHYYLLILTSSAAAIIISINTLDAAYVNDRRDRNQSR